MGTILWFQDPIRYDKMKESQILANCYAAVKPNSVMINKFSKEVEKLKKDNQITEDDSALLKNYEVLNSMLSDRVIGNIDNINKETTCEILNDIKIELRKDLNMKLKEEQQKNEKINKERNELEQRNNATIEIIKKNAKKKAKVKTFLIIFVKLIIPIIIIASDVYFNIMDFFKLDNKSIIAIRILVYSLISIPSIVTILKQVKNYNQIEEKLYRKICKKYKLEIL